MKNQFSNGHEIILHRVTWYRNKMEEPVEINSE
jgi:hypothetical protein